MPFRFHAHFAATRPAPHTKVVWGRSVVRALAALLLIAACGSPASAQVRQVVAAWDANVDPFTAGYAVFVGLQPGSTAARIDTGRQTSVRLDLPIGAVYYVSVRAYTQAGQLGPSSDIVVDLASLPGSPTGVRATVAGTLATLEWAPPQSAGVVLSYLVSVGTAPGASDVLANTPVGNRHSVSSHVPPGVYYARVQALGLLGGGAPSQDVAFQINQPQQPVNPTGLAVTWNGTVATFTWAPPTSSDPRVLPTAYVLEAGSASGLSNMARVNTGAARSFTVDVPPGTFYVRVRGINAVGVSQPSNEVVVTGRGAPERPGTLRASGSGNSVTLRWSAPSSGTAPAGYIVEVGSAAGLSNIGRFNVGATTTLSTTVPPGTYYVRVRAYNARGTSSPTNEVVVRR